jgi:hypothetical protein
VSDDQGTKYLPTLFGALLFVAWTLETVLWITSTISAAAAGDAGAVVTAVLSIVLLAILAGMEGLEVAVIDRWRGLFPGRPASALARWLSARQLFVALTVTSTTLLARRTVIALPGTSLHVTSGIASDLFDLTWAGFAVLWVAQIAPKALAATNPDKYLRHLRAVLFPVVEFVLSVGISKPGEWIATWIARRTDWIPAGESTATSLRRSEPSWIRGWRALTSGEAEGDRTDPPA